MKNEINPGQIDDEDERGHDVAQIYLGTKAVNILLGAALTLVGIAGVINLGSIVINKFKSLENKVSTQTSVPAEPTNSNSPTYDMGFYSCSDFETEKHTIEEGETFDGIMLKYKMLRKEMRIMNSQVFDTDYIRSGQQLNVFKRKIEIHKIKSGENLEGIAGIYGVNVEDILKQNQIYDSDKIYPGDSLEIITKYRYLKKDFKEDN